MNRAFGIDLGTTHSAMAVVDETGRPRIVPNRSGKAVTPSYVLFRDKNEVVVGDAAKQAAQLKVDDVAQFVKRRMHEPDWDFEDSRGARHSVEEISALVLKKLKQDCESSLGETVKSVVITVPAYFGDLERNRTKMAGEIAGLNVLRLINEPTAAAIAHGIGELGRDSLTLVYDLGGGTFDVTLLSVSGTEIEVVATDGNRRLGGVDFDESLCDLFFRTFEEEHGVDPSADPVVYQDFFSRAEAAKIALSDDSLAYVALSAAGKTTQLELERSTFEDLIRPRLQLTMELAEEVLEAGRARLEKGISWRDVGAVLLVGGSTRIPLVAEMVNDLTGCEIVAGINPDEVVAIGAAIVAAQETGEQIVDKNLELLPAVKFTDVTAHSLGVVALDTDRNELYNSIIVPKNTPVPFEMTGKYTTVEDNQTSVQCTVLEGEDREPEYCTKLGEGELKGIPQMGRGEPDIEATFRFDSEGIVHFSAREVTSGANVEFDVEIPGLLTKPERQAAIRRVEEYDVN